MHDDVLDFLVAAGALRREIGDPSGKSAERTLFTREKAVDNAEGIRKQLSRFFDLATPRAGLMLNNADWLTSLNLIDFLREAHRIARKAIL